jgi:Gram-negative bacterial TonB protein C-terminal
MMSLKLLFLTFYLNTHAATDSVPALRNIRQEDIDTAFATFKGRTITVKLKTGETYTYTHDQWSKQMDYRIKLAPQLDEATGLLDRTFTKVENPPTFPGGDTAWQNYLQKFYSDNKKLIRVQGPATIWVQFIVGFDGEIDQVSLITDDSRPKLGDLAIRIIQEGPNWLPATQNGHKVSCYQKQKFEFK